MYGNNVLGLISGAEVPDLCRTWHVYSCDVCYVIPE